MTTKLVLLVIGCFILSVSAAPKKQVRVIGGRNATAGKYPYQVLLLEGADRYIRGGGSIIAPDLILTAAHCIYGHDAKEMVVVAGTTNLVMNKGVSKTVKKSLYHENYKRTSNGKDYDIALIWLTEPFTYNKLISAIALPSAFRQPTTGAATLTGFGMTGPNEGLTPYLQVAILNIEPYTTCSKYSLFTPRMICAADTGKPNSCPGDSGGPLVKDGVLVGVVSWGWGCGTQAASFYTNVNALRTWIKTRSGV